MKRALALLAVLVLGAGCVITSDHDTCENYCSDPWYLNFCEEGTRYGSDCNRACISDDRVYRSTCGGAPAVAGECDGAAAECVCWCEDAFDQCLDEDTIRYTREGVEYTLSCGQYCPDGGTCDDVSRACACS